MHLAHRSIVAALLLLGVAWAMCLILAGLHAFRLGFRGETTDLFLVLLGIAGVAAGNFVFMEVVADRLVTPASRRTQDAAEITAAGLMILALAVSAVLWFIRILP